MKRLIPFIILAAVLTSCIRREVVTTSTQHVITRIDTIGSHVRLHIRPVGKPQSSMPARFQPGQVITVLKDHFIRTKK